MGSSLGLCSYGLHSSIFVELLPAEKVYSFERCSRYCGARGGSLGGVLLPRWGAGKVEAGLPCHNASGMQPVMATMVVAG